MSGLSAESAVEAIKNYNLRIYDLAQKVGATWYPHPLDQTEALEQAVGGNSYWSAIKQVLEGYGLNLGVASTAAELSNLAVMRYQTYEILRVASELPVGNAQRRILLAVWREMENCGNPESGRILMQEKQKLISAGGNADEIALYNLLLANRTIDNYRKDSRLTADLAGLGIAPIIFIGVIIGCAVIGASVVVYHISASQETKRIFESGKLGLLERNLKNLSAAQISALDVTSPSVSIMPDVFGSAGDKVASIFASAVKWGIVIGGGYAGWKYGKPYLSPDSN